MTFEPGREMTEFLTLGSSVWKWSAGWIERAGEAVRKQEGGSHGSRGRSGGGLVEEVVGGKEQGVELMALLEVKSLSSWKLT